MLEKPRAKRLTKEKTNELRELREQAIKAGLAELALLIFLSTTAYI